MNNDAEPESKSRKWAMLLYTLAVFVILAGGFMLTWHYRIGPQRAKKKAESLITYWFIRERYMTAEEAEVDLRARLASTDVQRAIGLIPKGDLAAPHQLLGSKYFAEGQYAKALDRYELAKRIEHGEERDPSYLSIYVAGLARSTVWLRARLDREAIGRETLRDRFILANIEWGEQNLPEVLRLTDLQVAPDQSNIAGWDPAAKPWIGFLRAKALLKVDRAEEAYRLLLDMLQENPQMTSDGYFPFHCALILIEATETTGRNREALTVAEIMARRMGYWVDKSWDKSAEELTHILTRLKGKVRASTGPATTRAGTRPEALKKIQQKKKQPTSARSSPRVP